MGRLQKEQNRFSGEQRAQHRGTAAALPGWSNRSQSAENQLLRQGGGPGETADPSRQAEAEEEVQKNCVYAALRYAGQTAVTAGRI